MPAANRAVSHLSRLSLKEFNNERAAELATVDLGDYGSIPTSTVMNNEAVTCVTRVTKPVEQSNRDQLDDFRSKLGLMNEEQLQEFKLKHGLQSRKNGEAVKSSDLVSVRTPNHD